MSSNLKFSVRAFLLALARSIRHARERSKTPLWMLTRSWRAFRSSPREFVRKVTAFADAPPPGVGDSATGVEALPPAEYERWLEALEPVQLPSGSGLRISVVMPTFNTPKRFLQEAIDSVGSQIHSAWELCIADDASSHAHVRALIESAAQRDSRVRFALRREQGGISRASNDALALASGEYVAFLDHDDVLTRDALAAVATRIAETGADIVYTDHDYFGEDRRYRNPFFKPDWSPDLFLAQMYLAHLIVVRTELVRRIGGFRPECDGSQDYDLVLRCALAGARIEHVPRVAYHWRHHSGSTAGNHQSKPYAHEAGRRAIQDYLDIAHPGARVENGFDLFCYDVRYPLPQPVPIVSVIMHAGEDIDLLSRCIDTISRATAYDRFELLIVGNRVADLAALGQNPRIRVLPAPIPHNWSRLSNVAAARASGDVLIFLDGSFEPMASDWLRRLAENALRPGIGFCSPLLLREDGAIRDAGVVLEPGGRAGHLFRGLPPVHEQRLFVSPMMRRNVSAITSSCMAVAAATFRKLGGFDESLQLWGAVEICLRARQKAFDNLYLPEVRLLHRRRSGSDAHDTPEFDFRHSVQEYGRFQRDGDPMYNPNLDPMSPAPRLKGVTNSERS